MPYFLRLGICRIAGTSTHTYVLYVVRSLTSEVTLVVWAYPPNHKMDSKRLLHILTCLLFLLHRWSVVRGGEYDRQVRWYVNTNVESNINFAREHTNAVTGWYGCCNLFSVDANGTASQRSDDLSTAVDSMKHAVENRTLTFHAVFSVNDAAIHSGSALDAVPDLVRLANSSGIDGLLCDYEPTVNYTVAHAQAYAAFLDRLAVELHTKGMELGMDVAGWSILDYFNVYGETRVDFFTSMTPTYDAKNLTRDRSFVEEYVGVLGDRRTAVGIGSVPATGYEKMCSNMPDYGWSNQTLSSFVGWLKTDAGIKDVDVWRCDIDHTGGKTAPWFLSAMEGFLRAT